MAINNYTLEWDSHSFTTPHKGQVFIELQTPLRFKIRGDYTTNVSSEDFLSCFYRRAFTLCDLYGESDGEENSYTNNEIKIENSQIKWSSDRRYSSRQKVSMSLGGIIGSFKLVGTFPPFVQALLEFNKIANAGKNTNFGLGQLDYWTQWEN